MAAGTSAERARWLQWLPGWQVLRNYQRSWLRRDVAAGLVLTTMLLPVGLAYAEASGVPGICGLYATIGRGTSRGLRDAPLSMRSATRQSPSALNNDRLPRSHGLNVDCRTSAQLVAVSFLNTDHRPLNCGVRFARKAATPSA